ncbi:hypothetical protein BT63DRAFT_418949 [Microthyrium microscopicum]|uniref:Azaphilone pigments biosynthesis cluster protein L N-terminal domain-containing protein n=1 Tax=Microthyrium microscopicum TaxID=703497 RepID=A0A6A6TVW9_9PEZI|nr:hypothetical protein BT63DRAFT_418949 [Microthyrium microscopicum]
MDPITITKGSITAIQLIASTSQTIYKFIRSVRDSRADLDAVELELSQIKRTLELLRDDIKEDADGSLSLPAQVGEQVIGILECCSEAIQQIEKTLEKYDSMTKRSLGKQIKWAEFGKPEINKARDQLETHKRALQLSVDVMSWAVTKQIKQDTGHILDKTTQLIGNVDNVKLDTEQILEVVFKLQAMLTKEQSAENENRNYVLNRFLENLTTYTETVVERETVLQYEEDRLSQTYSDRDVPEQDSSSSHEETPSTSRRYLPGHLENANSIARRRSSDESIHNQRAPTPPPKIKESDVPRQVANQDLIPEPSEHNQAESLSLQSKPSVHAIETKVTLGKEAKRITRSAVLLPKSNAERVHKQAPIALRTSILPIHPGGSDQKLEPVTGSNASKLFTELSESDLAMIAEYGLKPMGAPNMTQCYLDSAKRPPVLVLRAEIYYERRNLEDWLKQYTLYGGDINVKIQPALTRATRGLPSTKTSMTFAIVVAANSGDLNWLKWLVAKGANINITSTTNRLLDGKTSALLETIFSDLNHNEWEEQMQFLVSKGASFEAKYRCLDREHESRVPSILEVFISYTEFLPATRLKRLESLITSHGVTASKDFSLLNTIFPINWNRDVAVLLLEKGAADPNQQRSGVMKFGVDHPTRYGTPLQLAVLSENVVAVALLLQHGANPNLRAPCCYFVPQKSKIPWREKLIFMGPEGDIIAPWTLLEEKARRSISNSFDTAKREKIRELMAGRRYYG